MRSCPNHSINTSLKNCHLVHGSLIFFGARVLEYAKNVCSKNGSMLRRVYTISFYMFHEIAQWTLYVFALYVL